MAEPKTPPPRKTSPKHRRNKRRQQVTADAVAVTERRARVAEMIKAGVSYRQIAERENVSLGTVAADKAAIMADWQATYVGHFHEQMLIDLKRSDHLIMHLHVQMQADPEEPRHLANYVKVLNYRKDVLGYAAKDRREQPIQFPELEGVIETKGEVLDGDGNPITDKAPAARIFALLGGRRQSGTGGESGAAAADSGSGAD